MESVRLAPREVGILVEVGKNFADDGRSEWEKKFANHLKELSEFGSVFKYAGNR